MPNFEDERRLSGGRLLLLGVPSVLAVIVVSILIHQYSHLLAHRLLSGAPSTGTMQTGGTGSRDAGRTVEKSRQVSPIEVLAGPSATFMAALLSFALFVRFPRNLFLAAMAFVNASARLPESLILLARLFFRQRSDFGAGESSIFSFLHLHNPTAGIVVLCFISLTLLFMSLTIILETRSVRWKWLVAVGMFAALIPLQPIVWKIVAPVIM